MRFLRNDKLNAKLPSLKCVNNLSTYFIDSVYRHRLSVTFVTLEASQCCTVSLNNLCMRFLRNDKLQSKLPSLKCVSNLSTYFIDSVYRHRLFVKFVTLEASHCCTVSLNNRFVRFLRNDKLQSKLPSLKCVSNLSIYRINSVYRHRLFVKFVTLEASHCCTVSLNNI